jgi:hypothetical protein
MSSLKDQFQRARTILDSLVHGVHPRTGDELSQDSVINEIEVTRAMATAVLALDQMSVRLARRAQLPRSVGKSWTEAEEQRLKDEFTRGETPASIAASHGRTVRAIEARLLKLGLLTFSDERQPGAYAISRSTDADQQ